MHQTYDQQETETMATYKVRARRSGDWWALDAPDVPGVHSQCKRLDQAADMAREAIAMVLDIDEDDVAVEVQPELPTKMRKLVLTFEQAREAQEVAARRAQQAQTEALHDLITQCHLSYRDVGQIVGLSHQRISQVLREAGDGTKVDA